MADIELDDAPKMEGNKDEAAEKADLKNLFEVAMENNWKEVVKAYHKYPAAHTALLTKAEETALHVAISCYHPDEKCCRDHLKHIMQMVEAIEMDQNNAVEILSLKDAKGNTPLHLVAALGSVRLCRCLASRHPQLIAVRNYENETPLFLAAHHGKLETFLCLHDELCKAHQDHFSDAVCRRGDGDTILHSAISGEYFQLAYQIICYYPKLVNSVNVDGDSPLNILARKPSAFESSNQLRFYDKIIYECVFAPKLKKEKYYLDTDRDISGPNSNINYPENYQTCVNFSRLLGKLILRSIGSPASLFKGKCSRNDEENPPKSEKECEVVSPWSISNKMCTIGGTSRFKEEEDKDERFPANYATCVLFFQSLMMFLLVIFGLGYAKINKIREKKIRRRWAYEIMNGMIQLEEGYEYHSNGQKPTRNVPLNRGLVTLPDTPPEHDHDSSSEEACSRTISPRASKKKNDGKTVENGSGATGKQDNRVQKFVTAVKKGAKKFNMEKNFVLLTYENKQTNAVKRKETPFIIAAKMGITEMVEKILDKIPVAIHDLDANDKNALLLAIENRQTKVFHCLLQRQLPEFVFRQVDNRGNGARHLAAKFRPNHHWRFPGAALQMHGEVTWFKHVKRSLPPLRFARYNMKGETPRDIFRKTHENLAREGTEWLIKTSESCSLVAALIATVAFATSVSVPGGLDEKTGYPVLQNEPVFKLFSFSSLVALCFSLTALVFFLAIITSRCQVWDFKTILPRKLLMGLSCLFTSIAAIMASFCAGHFFILTKNLQYLALPLYTVISVPVTIFVFAQLPLYFDLMQAVVTQVPIRNHKVSYL